MLARHCLHDSLLHALIPSEGNWNRLSIPWHEPFDRLRVLNSLHCESIWIEEHNEHVGFLAITRETICKRDFSAWEVIVARMTLDKNLHYCSRIIWGSFKVFLQPSSNTHFSHASAACGFSFALQQVRQKTIDRQVLVMILKTERYW